MCRKFIVSLDLAKTQLFDSCRSRLEKMPLSRLSAAFAFTLAILTPGCSSAPTQKRFPDAQKLADPNYGPMPGQSTLYSDYRGLAPPFPANITGPVYPTAKGPAGPDDVVWQNLLAAEWVIFNLYQQGVEAFNSSAFIDAGFPNTTYDRIQEIRDNEAGHLRIFQNQISPTSIKPGQCQYQFPFTDAVSFLALQTLIEIASMAFLTGLVQEPQSSTARGAMLAISEVETRHEVWGLIDIWDVNPFGGPSDSLYPYENQILQTTNNFVVPGSCPKDNPPYPYPDQNLPRLSVRPNTTSIAPETEVVFEFTDAANQPKFEPGKDYFAVFFHAVSNVSVPIDVSNWPDKDIVASIPEFEERGIILAVIANETGAPNLCNVVAGPDILLQQPAQIGVAFA